jgi:hypothetical protein
VPVVRARNVAGVAAFAFGLIAAGCGAGDQSTFEDDANAICARVVRSARASLRHVEERNGDRDAAFDRLVAERGRALTDLHELVAPPRDAARVMRMLRHFDRSQRLLREAAAISGEGSIGVLLAADAEGEKGNAVARSIGLADCAEF